MEELSQKNNVTFMWGSVAKIMCDIDDTCSTIDGGWPEIIEMVADCFEDAKDKPVCEVFANIFNFLYRLNWRIKTDPRKRPFNTVSEEEESFTISNYDYATFKWAKSLGVKIEHNDKIVVPKVKLTTKQCTALSAKC